MATEPDEIEAPIDDVAADIRTAVEQLSKGEAESSQNSDEQTESARARDASGKFVKLEPQTPAALEKPITDADQTIEQPKQQSNADGPPKGWSADAKTEWSKLPPAIQAAVVKRESEIDEGGRQWSEQRRAIEQTLSPLHQLSQQNGIEWTEGLNRLLNVEANLRNPATAAQMIGQLAQAYNVNLAALVNGSPQPQRQQPQFDPNVIPQIIDQRLTEWQTDQVVNSTLTGFQAARGVDGQPLYPHFEKVKAMMGHLMASGQIDPSLGPEESMRDAYEKAIWINADTRPQAAAAPPQDQQQVARAKRAAVSVSGAPSGPQAKANGFDPKQSLDDDIREAIAMHRH